MTHSSFTHRNCKFNDVFLAKLENEFDTPKKHPGRYFKWMYLEEAKEAFQGGYDGPFNDLMDLVDKVKKEE